MRLENGQELLVIGVTGPSGAGKSELCRHMARRGLPVIDADAVYHDLLIPPSPCLDALVDAFGIGILDSQGALDRAALSGIVFSESDGAKADLLRLNAITHRFVSEQIFTTLSHLAEGGAKAAVIDAPLLIEAGLNRSCDTVIAVLADRQARLERLRLREGKSLDVLDARLKAQPTDDFYREHADVVIENALDTKELQRRADVALADAGVSI